MSDFNIKRNDTRPYIQVDITTDPTDVIQSVKFSMKNVATGAVKLNAVAATIVTQPATGVLGRVRYQWVSGDTDTSGAYIGEFEVTFSDSRKETYPNTGYINITITDDLG